MCIFSLFPFFGYLSPIFRYFSPQIGPLALAIHLIRCITTRARLNPSKRPFFDPKMTKKAILGVVILQVKISGSNLHKSASLGIIFGTYYPQATRTPPPFKLTQIITLVQSYNSSYFCMGDLKIATDLVKRF